MSQLYETNATLDFYCDFEKIQRNVADVAISLNTLNYLIGKDDIEAAVDELWKRDQKVFDCLDILIATRRKDNKRYLLQDKSSRKISELFKTKEGVVAFLYGTGLARLFQKREISNLVDYVFGIETGLDTNARKNRSGHIMEKTVAKLLKDNGITFRQEVYSSEFPQLSVLGKDKKRFDFYINTPKKKYLIEVNFYSSGGSKLNEVARAYTELAPKVNSVAGFEFIWITDGIGWKDARNKLEEAYNTIPSVYNLTNIGSFIEQIKK